MLVADDVTQKSEDVVMLDDLKSNEISIPSFMVRKSVYENLKTESNTLVTIEALLPKQEKPKLDIWLSHASSLTVIQLTSLSDHLTSLSPSVTTELHLLSYKCSQPSSSLSDSPFCPLDDQTPPYSMLEIVSQKCILHIYDFGTWLDYASDTSQRCIASISDCYQKVKDKHNLD